MIEIAIPERMGDKEKTTKDMVFSILAEGSPKTLTELQKEIKRIYRVSVSFQAVIKAVRSLQASNIISKTKRVYALNKEWIFETRNFFDRLYTEHFNVQKPMKKVELGAEVIVYTVNNLLELDRLWNDLLINWARNEKSDKRNVWSGKHCWWLIPRLQEEDFLHDFLLKEEVKTYNIILGNSVLDKISLKYYKHKNENAQIKKRVLDKDSHISAFGDFLLKFQIPEYLSKRLESLYSKVKRVEDLNLKEALDIFKENALIEVTVIKDNMLANKIKEEIIAEF